MDGDSGQAPGGVSPGESSAQTEVGAGGEARTHTSEAEGVVPGQRVQEACLVGVEVDGSHAGLVPATGGPRGDYGVAEAAVGQPASIAFVQAEAPGGIELARGGQCGILGFTELQGFLEGELFRACDEEHLPWGQRQRWQRDLFCPRPGQPLLMQGKGCLCPTPPILLMRRDTGHDTMTLPSPRTPFFDHCS